MTKRLNQPIIKKEDNTFGRTISVSELVNANCDIPVPQITALDKREFGELMLLGFDIEESDYVGNGKIEMSAYGPKMQFKNLKISEKNIAKVFGGEVMISELKATVREFGNDVGEYEATKDVTNDNTATFTTVSGLAENDSVLIIQSNVDSKTIQAKVKITSVDTATNELTFDSPVTLVKGDTIQYINSAQGGCMDNTKRIANFDTSGLVFEYYTQFFAREVELRVVEFNKYFNTGSQAYEIFTSKFWIKPSTEIFKQVARQFRHGSGIGGNTSEILGYNTLIEQREAAGLKSIHDMSSFTTAQDLQLELEYILEKVNMAPVDSKFVLIVNRRFYESYRNMMRKLYDEARARACCQLQDSLYRGMMKWELEDAPMLDVYVSESLSDEQRNHGVAYILPIDLIAGFVPNVFNVTLAEGNANGKMNTINATPNMFGTIFTREKKAKETAECKIYEHYTRLGFLYAGVSFRDTYHRIDNFDFELRR